jgi:hypothetical protein
MLFGVCGTSWLQKPGPIPEGYCLPCLERNLRCHYRSKSRPITRATEIEPLMGNPIKEETAVLLRIQLFPPLESSNNLVYGL